MNDHGHHWSNLLAAPGESPLAIDMWSAPVPGPRRPGPAQLLLTDDAELVGPVAAGGDATDDGQAAARQDDES